MKVSEYSSYDAIGLAELVARGETTARELAETAMLASEKLNPAINAVIEVWLQSGSPGTTRGTNAGPLAGVPFLIKDLGISHAGKRNEMGSRLAAGLVADSDSNLMRKFNEAGLVTIGRTTTPELAFSTTTESALMGPTRNPWRPELSAGGSSGGSGAAVAAGIVPLAHATDAAGSIRVPAAYNGLFGLKPTRGRSSNGPAFDEIFAGLGVQLGVSRTVRDSAALLDAIQGNGSGEPYLTAPPSESFLSEVGRAPGRLKIGVMPQPGNGETSSPVMSDAANTVARQLISLGHDVEEAQLPLGASWEAIVFANAQIWTATLVNWIEALAAATQRKISLDTLEPATMACYLYGKKAKAADFAAALDIRNRVTRAMGDWFGRYDILLTPTLPELPMAHGLYAAGADTMDGLEWTARLFRHSPFTPAFNMSGLPAMSMPLVQDAASGLPLGLQFGAGFAQENVLLRLAGQLEQAMPWIGRKPGIWAGALD